jgi:hypothetical protein
MSVLEGVERAHDIRSRMTEMKHGDPRYDHLQKQLIAATKASMAGG